MVDPQGRAVLAFTTHPAPDVFHVGAVVLSSRPHGDVFSEPAVVPGPVVEPRVAVARGARAAIAVTRTDECPEAGCFGPPGVALLAAGSTPGSPFGPSLAAPQRAYAPTVALTERDRGVLVFQTKTTRSLDSKEDPVRAVAFAADGSVGPMQTLTSARASEPVAMPLSGRRALALWAGTRRLGAALAGPGGGFQMTAAPDGAPPKPGYINPTNRDLRTGAAMRSSHGRATVALASAFAASDPIIVTSRSSLERPLTGITST